MKKNDMYLKENHLGFEYAYARSIARIIEKGVLSHNLTGIDTLAVQHQYFYLPDVQNNFPILRGKKVYPKMALKELIWMLMGRTDVQWLNDRKVTYWDEWKNDKGTIGKSYGYQYRNFNLEDQLEMLIESLSNNPTSRRHIINLWNVSDLDEMVLPPCMYDYHFSCVPITDNTFQLDLHVHARSNDSFLGVPYDFMFCGWFVNLITLYMSLFADTKYKFIAGDIHYTADDYHLYVNHTKAVAQYFINVASDKSGVVSKNKSTCHIDTAIFANERVNNIDDFLKVIDKNISSEKISIVQKGHNSHFSYVPIKADIAV